MRHIKLPQLDGTSVRLALTYLSIIMVLVIGFSVFFYRVSTDNLSNLSIQVYGNGHMMASAKSSPPLNAPIGVGGIVNSSGTTNSIAPLVTYRTAATLNRQLTKQVALIRTSLWQRLLLLNVVALLVGAAFSYYLARRSLRPMEQAMDAQTRFASDASHELRTPLAAIIARNEVALRKSKLTLTEAKQVIESGTDQAVKLQRLSDGLLRLSRNDGRGLKLEPVSLADVATEAMNRVITLAQEKHITLNDHVTDVTILGDVDSLVEIVTILLNNAIKYSDHGGIIYMDGGSEGKYGVLSVRDEGSGIRATDLPHIFERFYRADYARTKHGEHGYGLGLSIAKKLAAQNKAVITVESTLGEGSTFTLRLPVARL